MLDSGEGKIAGCPNVKAIQSADIGNTGDSADNRNCFNAPLKKTLLVDSKLDVAGAVAATPIATAFQHRV